jgi:hypothetical protein
MKYMTFMTYYAPLDRMAQRALPTAEWSDAEH